MRDPVEPRPGRWSRWTRSGLHYYLAVALFLALAPLLLTAASPSGSLTAGCPKGCRIEGSCFYVNLFATSRPAPAAPPAEAPYAAHVRLSAMEGGAEVWVELGATGIITPTQGGGLVLDELAEKGYLAVRLPHAPPDYAPSALAPGIPPDEPDALVFSYYSPPDATTLESVTVPSPAAPSWRHR